MTKGEARSAARAAVAAMSDAEREWASGAIADALTSLDEFKRARRPFVFLSKEGEPDTYDIVGLLLALERTVSVPRVVGREMQAVVITPYTDFRKNRFGIEEPARGRATDLIDLAIVPLVAFDGMKRVGHGGGYYDRFLAGRDCPKIGLAFSAQRVGGVQTLPHDIPHDLIITEKEILRGEKAEINPFFGE